MTVYTDAYNITNKDVVSLNDVASAFNGAMTISASTVTTAVFRADGDTIDLEIFISAITTAGTANNGIRFTVPVGSITGNPVLKGYTRDASYDGGGFGLMNTTTKIAVF